jgi:hypothetical protein
VSQAFTWHTGGRKAELALALAALRPGSGRFPWTLAMGPMVGVDGRMRTGVSVRLGLYTSPQETQPMHSTLAGMAEETAPGLFARGFFLRDLLAHVVPFGGRLLYGCADGPGWRVVAPVRIIPDAQFLAGSEAR